MRNGTGNGAGNGARALLVGGYLALAGGLAGGAMGCQALYGGKPEKMRNPERRPHAPEPPEPAAEVKYIEECAASFRGPPQLTGAEPASAKKLVAEGDAALEQIPKAKEPAALAELVKQSIDKYRSALVKDPYNHEATLKLAIAYDMVYRKGCALALLKRIAALEAHPRYKSAAKRIADEVADTPAMFKGYRKDAVAAVGR